MGKEGPSHKLGTLMSMLDQLEKEKGGSKGLEKEGKGLKNVGTAAAEEGNNNSNRFKDVKTVNIVKKRNANF